MQSLADLSRTLQRIDGKGYKAYKDIQGAYEGDGFELYLDHVQGDPFAAPSNLRLRLPHDFPHWSWENRSREVALRDFLARQFARAIRRYARGDRGSGKSGLVMIDQPGQEILERTAVLLYGPELEVRFRVGLPAFGRKIAGRQAEDILTREIPDILEHSLRWEAIDPERLREHLFTNEDADALRALLPKNNLIAFVADGALLPRASGVDPRPLREGVPFRSPDSLRVELQLPHRKVSGMGIGPGISLIVGGGYHGKSTLLNALELGVYNHLPADGRAFVVTHPAAVKIRAEDGRPVAGVNIAPFINNLPHGKDTRQFNTENASGSTSQAANTIEALEAGASVLLIDEDTSATNFMIRDYRMQQLVPKEREPITPFLDKARQLQHEKGVSSVLVIGGSGLYFSIADRVICMVEYQPHDLTQQAKAIADEADARRQEGDGAFGALPERRIDAASIDPARGRKNKIRAHATRSLQFGDTEIDLSAVEQLTDHSQLNAIGEALVYLKKYLEYMTLPQAINRVMADIENQSLDVLDGRKRADLAEFRKLELAAALNRLRTLRAGRASGKEKGGV